MQKGKIFLNLYKNLMSVINLTILKRHFKTTLFKRVERKVQRSHLRCFLVISIVLKEVFEEVFKKCN